MYEDISPALDDDYKQLIAFYFRIKKLVAAAEREDLEQRISISAINELRSAFDHVMRTQGLIYGIVEQANIRQESGLEPSEYCKMNLDKAYGHLYRAGYDAYDTISIRLIDEIENMLKRISRRTLHSVMKDATSRIAKPYLEAKSLFVEAKIRKDVESRDQEERQFRIYEDANLALCSIRDLILEDMDELVRYQNEARATKIWDMIIALIIAFIVGVLVTILGVIIL